MGRSSAGGPDGIAVIDKEAGWTSHDVVAKSRGIIGTRKIGHSGTLDPDATGVLVLGVGRATRLLRFLTLLPKSYSTMIHLGVETSTLDASGEVTATHDMSAITSEEVRAAAVHFVGNIEQIPPMVSAIKVDGRRLYELARQGIEIERAPRLVRVDRFDVSPTDDPLVWRAVIECSSGTYVRSLAADLGTSLGGGAHLDQLRRTAVGEFVEADAQPLEHPVLLPLIEAARGMTTVNITEEQLAAVRVGRVLEASQLGGTPDEQLPGDGPWYLIAPDGELVAVYERHRDGTRVKPAVVLIS